MDAGNEVMAARPWMSVARRLRTGLFSARWRLSATRPRALAIAPPHLIAGDPVTASDLYAGHYVLAGRSVFADGASIFTRSPPSPAFARALHGFEWLAHFDAAESQILRAHAVELVAEWLALPPHLLDAEAFGAAATARRLISWLSFSPLLLSNVTMPFYTGVLAAMARDGMRLRDIARRGNAGSLRLPALIALTFLALSTQGSNAELNRLNRELSETLAEDILADGAHVSRAPLVLLRLCADLIPLRSTYHARNLVPPPAIGEALERAAAFLDMVRHGDGGLACFHGVGTTPRALLGTVLSLVDGRGTMETPASRGGIERLQAGGGLVLIDTGLSPPQRFSEHAHVSPLAFEYSLGDARIVINCGAPPEGYPDLQAAMRATAAHSTVRLGGVDPIALKPRRAADGLVALRHGATMQTPPVRRTQDGGGATVALSHDGYARNFATRIERTLMLSADGFSLAGVDRLTPLAGGRRARPAGEAEIRFHLHPNVGAALAEDGETVHLSVPGLPPLRFEAGGRALAVEESVSFGTSLHTRACWQIVVRFDPSAVTTVAWTFSSANPLTAFRRGGSEPA